MALQDFIGLVQSLSPAMGRLLLRGHVETLDSYSRASTINAAGFNPRWFRTKQGYWFSASPSYGGGGGIVTVEGAEQRALSGTIFLTARRFDIRAVENGIRLVVKRDAGGAAWDLAIGSSANVLSMYDGTNTRTFTSAALAAAKSLSIRWTVGGIPQLFVDGAYRVNGSGTLSPTADDAPIVIGNQYTYGAPSLWNQYGAFLLFNDAILGRAITDQEISELHDAWERIGSVFQPKRTISLPRKATDIVATPPLLHLAGERNGANLLLDLSGNGRNGTISGRVTQTKGPCCTRHSGHGAGNPLVAAAADTNLYPDSFTLELRYIARSRGESNQGCLWSVSDGGTTRSRLFLGAANVWWYEVAYAGSTARWTFAAGPYSLPHELTIKHARSLGTAPTVTLDGETLTVTEAVAASGALTAAAAPVVNRLNTAALDSDFDGDLLDEKEWGSLLTDAECRALYVDHALSDVRRLANRTDYPVSVANVTAVGKVGPWKWRLGTLNWSDDGTRRRLLGAATSEASAPSAQLYGAWYLRGKKGTDAGVVHLPIAAVAEAAVASFNGYVLTLGADESVVLNRIAAGTPAAVVSSAAAAIVVGTEYEFFVTHRARDGLWTVWIRGGAYTTWTSLGTPAVNTAHSSSTFLIAQMDNGGYVADFTMIPNGHSLLPTEIPWLAAA